MTEPKNQVALLPEPDSMTPMQMLQIAVAKGVDTEQIKALMELQREWKAERAQEAFTKAMNDFRMEAIILKKSRAVRFKTDGPIAYRHVLLSDAVKVISPALYAHGLSHRWETKQDGTGITVTCIITHELGHSIRTSLTASPDTTGNKNAVQAIGSTVTYLERYSLLALTGIATEDGDNDGAGAETTVTITASQAKELEALMLEVGVIGERRDRALKAWKVTELSQLKAQDFAAVMAAVEARRK